MPTRQGRSLSFSRLKLALGCGTMLGASMAIPAMAQSLSPDAPPIRSMIDENGVNLTTGKVMTTINPLAIGDPAQGGLAFYQSVGSVTTNPYSIYMTANATSAQLAIGTESRTFTKQSGNFVSAQGAGDTLVSNSVNQYTYTATDGTVIVFQRFDGTMTTFYATSVTSPTGYTQTLHYKAANYCGGSSCVYVARLQSVTNNLGYQLKFNYKAASPNPDLSDFYKYDLITAINNGVDYCNPTADSCTSLTQAWPKLQFYGNNAPGYFISQVYDSLNRLTENTFESTTGRLRFIRRPTSPVPPPYDYEYQYGGDGRVQRIIVGGVTTDYSFSISGGITTGIVYDNLGKRRLSVTMDTATEALKTVKPGADRNNQEWVTTYTTDTFGRTTAIAFPDGNSITKEYDARGNLKKNTTVPVASSGLPDLVEQWDFDVTCVNIFKCNQPNWYRDPRGNQTDYSYGTTTGVIVSVTSPAPTTGATRPRVDYGYLGANAWYKNSSGSIVSSGSGVVLRSSQSSCTIGVSCDNTASQRRFENSYQAGSSTTYSNLALIATTAKAGDNSISAITSYTYDIFGNRLTVDGPVAGTGDTVTYKYDALRRLTGVISPDPDGAGPEKRVALRYSYTGRGDLTQQETGTVNGATDPDFAAFVMSYRTISEKDNVGRTIRNRTETGATTYTIQDIIYDNRGRVACTMQRMNPASWAANATSCTPTQTTGPQGPDRVYRFTYDEADTLIATEDGYGTSAVATEQRYFTKNGRLSAIVDANNNRTNYAYDGYDRLWKTYFPNPVKGSNDPNYTADFEQLTYNGNSIVTNKRLRDGSTINYGIDELNRTISMGGPVADRTYTYNQLSQPLAVTFSTGGQSVSWQYDGLGRAITETQPYGSIASQYDLAGNVKRLTWADGFYVDYDRDDAYRVTKIRENGATTGIGVLAQYAYDSLSRQSTITYGNGTTRTYAYDPISRLSGLQINLTGTAADQTIGQVGGTGTAISYNAASQIANITKSNDAYAYTARTNVSRSYTTNGLNQYAAIGATTLDYDQRGNLTRNGAADYVYGKLNELTTAGGLNLSYDPVGRLMQINLSTTTRNYYAGNQLAAEVNTSGTILRRFVPGVGDDAPIIWYEGSGTTNRKFLQADERGSIVAVSDSSGNSLAINSYDEYGASASTGDGGRFRYTGQIWYPEIGLYNYKARFYSPSLGRFMQADPIGYSAGMNMYAYVSNDPINAVDPFGLCTLADYVNCGPPLRATFGYPSDSPRVGGGGGPNYDPGNPGFSEEERDRRADAAKLRNNATSTPQSIPCTGAGCKNPDPSTWDSKNCSQGINERNYPIPPGYTSAGQRGNRFVRDSNGAVQMNPNYAAARAGAQGPDWKGVAIDLTKIAGSVAITLRAGEIGGSIFLWDVPDVLRAGGMVGSSGAKAVYGLPGRNCFNEK